MRMIETVHAHEVTSMHCGGIIACVCEPEDTRQIQDFIRSRQDFHILGGGTNTIFDDGTITRPVMRLGKEFSGIHRVPEGITAGAAVSMKHLSAYCVKNGLAGLEFMAGIPGQLGGAIFMNAGTPEKGILDVIKEFEVVDGAGVRTMYPEKLGYGYRRSNIGAQLVITKATLLVQPSTEYEVRAAVLEYLAKRRSQPRGFSSGSIFKNPEGSPAGRLIDQAGLKGYRIGGARISEVHANFIINDGTATARDIRELIELVKETVRGRFGIALSEEVRIIGQ